MKCPKCGFISFDHLDSCKKCSNDLTDLKEGLNILSVFPKTQNQSGPPKLRTDVLDTQENLKQQPIVDDGEGVSLSDLHKAEIEELEESIDLNLEDTQGAFFVEEAEEFPSVVQEEPILEDEVVFDMEMPGDDIDQEVQMDVVSLDSPEIELLSLDDEEQL